MSEKEVLLLVKMIDLAVAEFENHGCNDVSDSVYEGWTLEERRVFVKEFRDWNGDPENYDENFLHLGDSTIMAFLGHKLKILAEK